MEIGEDVRRDEIERIIEEVMSEETEGECEATDHGGMSYNDFEIRVYLLKCLTMIPGIIKTFKLICVNVINLSKFDDKIITAKRRMPISNEIPARVTRPYSATSRAGQFSAIYTSRLPYLHHIHQIVPMQGANALYMIDEFRRQQK